MPAPRRIDAADLASVLPPGGLTLVSGCAAESAVLADAVEAAGAALADMSFCGIFVGGLNRRTWRAGPASRVMTFFLTPDLRREPERVEFLPLCYQDIGRVLRARRPSAALFMCAPPGQDGRCSFGIETAFLADLWRDIPVRIAHVNPSMPCTPGDPGVPFDALTAYVEADQPLLTLPSASEDSVSAAIARHAAPFIGDGATLQTGLGKAPDAILAALHDRRHLATHTGLMGDGLLRLIESGAIARPGAALVGAAIGSERLYGSLDTPVLQFRPPSMTHDPERLATIADLVTINSALQIDLFGQAYAELTPKGLMSGPGGASDFARGARTRGLRIVALPSDTQGGTTSRIVPAGRGAGPVSLGRMDLDVIVTEHGAADLRGLGHEARAQALIAVASENHRENLGRAWADFSKNL